ncbi:fimbria/pilus periplasmic chaperone [Enterobacter cloacae]|uniref:fimbria/pilus periplasmic chaperone n=1 Tax=Enterobacter cloacae TaxID=550 RepID=UPI002002B35E|nr:fimbria/pilus periplasmic chaperone [Enterobacter cloacae]MCK7268876.1 fimbria/pilus periplasmic chaperone [Enterobacter cloacae]
MRIKNLCFLIFPVLSGLNAGTSYAALTVDRSRLIFNEGEKSISLNVTNRNEQAPYLAQGWMEDGDEKKIPGPLMVLPPVQRVEAGGKTLVRIQTLPDTASLPKDRESVFYFNLREIPPKSDKKNVLTLAMQTRLKVFWRPKSLVIDSSKQTLPGTENILLLKQNGEYTLDNPTGYYFTFTEVRESAGGEAIEGFEPLMVSPKSSASLKGVPNGLGNTPSLIYVNDYGSPVVLAFSCDSGKCKVKS